MTNWKKAVPITLAMSVILSGCFKDEPKPKPKAKPIVDRVTTIADLKSAYKYPDTGIMPMYNISQTKEFSIPFNAYMGDLPVSEVMSVHTDYSLSADNLIKTDIKPVSLNVGPTTFRLNPEQDVLTSKKGVWGSASVYYLVINYDLDSKEPTKLDYPIIIPFTVKSKVDTPKLKFTRKSDGSVALEWNKVKGVDGYRVYSLTRPTKQSENLKLTATQSGFAGMTKYRVDALKKTSFTDFSLNGKQGLVYDEDKNLTTMNEGLKGDYYVTTVVKGKEMGASNVVSTLDIARLVPHELGDSIDGEVYETIRALPKTVKVSQLDDTLADTDVVYSFDKVKVTENKKLTLKYTLQGTKFSGKVTVTRPTKDDLDRLKEAQTAKVIPVYVAPKNATSIVPSSKMLTTPKVDISAEQNSTEQGYKSSADKKSDKEQPKGDFDKAEAVPSQESTSKESKKSSDTEKELSPMDVAKTDIGKQKLTTETLVKQANKVQLTYPAMLEKHKVKIDASSAFEEYVALAMVNGQTEIDITAFPTYQEYVRLSDTIDKLILQNPLILGVASWKYDYVSRKIKVSYSQPVELMKQQQLTLLDKATKLKTKILKSSTGSVNKEALVYKELTNETGFVNPDGEKTSSAYSLLVDKTGTDIAYAKGYKLLSDMLNIPSIVVSGTYNGKPHVWNKVNFGTDWLNLDMTYYAEGVGIPYAIYNSADDVVDGLNLVEDKAYIADRDWEAFRGIDGSKDYYFSQNAVVDTVEEYGEVLTSKLSQGVEEVVIRTSVGLSEQDLYDATGSALQNTVPDKLATSQFSMWGNYLVVKTFLDDEETETNQSGNKKQADKEESGKEKPKSDDKKQPSETKQ